MKRGGLGDLLIRLAWFYFIGLWVGAFWLGAAWFFCATIVGIPIGTWMFNKAPRIMTLQPEETVRAVNVKGKVAYVFEEMPQPPFLMRAVWFLVFGWWVGALWIKLALALSLTFVLAPVSFWMINRAPFVMTLRRTP